MLLNVVDKVGKVISVALRVTLMRIVLVYNNWRVTVSYYDKCHLGRCLFWLGKENKITKYTVNKKHKMNKSAIYTMVIVGICQYVFYTQGHVHMYVHSCTQMGWDIQLGTVQSNNVLLWGGGGGGGGGGGSWRQWVGRCLINECEQMNTQRYAAYSVFVISSYSCPEFQVL